MLCRSWHTIAQGVLQLRDAYCGQEAVSQVSVVLIDGIEFLLKVLKPGQNFGEDPHFRGIRSLSHFLGQDEELPFR